MCFCLAKVIVIGTRDFLKANIMSFLDIFSKLTMPNEIYEVDFAKQTKTLDKAMVNKIMDICFLRYFGNRLKLLDTILVK